MSMMQYVKPLTFWGAIIAIVIGFISIAVQSLSLLSLLWLGPFWFMAGASTLAYVIFDVIAIICGFIVWRNYYPRLDTEAREIAIMLLILGILSWVAVGGILIFVAALLIFFGSEEK